MVEAANSGHPGLPLGAAPMAYALFSKHMRIHPGQPEWFDRDRFILSPGHGSALQYALLHIFGYDLSLEELKNFRQLGSKTPGHPEAGQTPGVECTTGPLGQGFANGVGMAMAEAWLAKRYNVGGARVIDHFTYAIVSDGDLMEGVALEAASLAGHLRLGKLIYLYDSNDISLDGPCDLSFGEDTAAKFRAMGWHVSEVRDGNDLDDIHQKVEEAKKFADQPSLIIVKTVIGFGSPLAGTSKVHGAPIGAEGVAETKRNLGWPEDAKFLVRDELAALASEAKQAGNQLVESWQTEFEKLKVFDSALAAELTHIMNGTLPDGWDSELLALDASQEMATRDAGKIALNAIANHVPWFIGGAADLAGSTKTQWSGSGNFSADDHEGRNLFFGVREHAMGAIVNGLCHHGMRALGSTFLVFSDYMRGSIRLSSLSHLSSLWVFTHDSVFVGEDGPTHQPIEHVAALRLIPGLKVYRPADTAETFACWREAFASGRAAAIIETRQKVKNYASINQKVDAGAYVLRDSADAKIIFVASGSEVGLAMESAEALALKGVQSRVVSMPCRESFMEQSPEYHSEILPGELPRISLEAGVTYGWRDVIGDRGIAIGIDRFGTSAPGEVAYTEMGMTVNHVVDAALRLIN